MDTMENTDTPEDLDSRTQMVGIKRDLEVDVLEDDQSHKRTKLAEYQEVEAGGSAGWNKGIQGGLRTSFGRKPKPKRGLQAAAVPEDVPDAEEEQDDSFVEPGTIESTGLALVAELPEANTMDEVVDEVAEEEMKEEVNEEISEETQEEIIPEEIIPDSSAIPSSDGQHMVPVALEALPNDKVGLITTQENNFFIWELKEPELAKS